MIMRTRVRFADGSEENDAWGDQYRGPAAVLTAAVTLAELRHELPHDGAWLEFGPGSKREDAPL